ncbi:hypothetical protein DC366_00695 [Pelagivirga sediminicola]|uniref:Efflux transporter periplasmic adaptor subunit n=1 Tax=Pelagivirga sediminicola TaxID=2170575 RepID=A0A2T7GAU5_9RHOB|nr:hypothetical protein DC366_00695 [Pelagivirga sediminicola]
MISTSEPPARVDSHERGVVAHTVMAEAGPVRAVVRGFGNVQAARSWEAISEVSGAITWRHPDLDTGNLLREGTRVLKIDPTAYELQVAQAEADLAALDAEAAQLDIDATNTERLLSLEQDRLDLAETELARMRDLVERGVASQSGLDGQERATLQVRRTTVELQNALDLIPTQRKKLDAQMARTKAILARARRDVEKTDIVVPFDLRVGSVHVQRHQFVTAGQPLVTADDVSQAQITAQIPLMSFRRLMGGGGEGSALSLGDMPTRFNGISAEVQLVSDPSQTWTGRLVRVESALDPQARSAPAVIVVDDPYANTNPPLHLPLVPNMYAEVILTGPVISTSVKVPGSAVHGGNLVYLRDADGRLELREVSVAWRQDGQAVLSGGIAPGEEVILGDLVPAIPGMIVTPAERPE